MASPIMRASVRILLAVYGVLVGPTGVSLALDYFYPDPSGNAPLVGPGAGSLTGSYWIALPANPGRIIPLGGSEVSITDCGTLLAMNPTVATLNIPNAVKFSRLDRVTNTLVDCACPGPACFSLLPGEAYFLRISAASTFTIVGTHAYTMIPLLGPGPDSLDGTNPISLPWTTGLTTANELLQSAGFANTISVLRYLSDSDTYQVYTGRKGSPSPDFPLYDTRGYLVRVAATKYWAAPYAAVPPENCDSLSGDFAAGSTADTMAAAFCAAFTAKSAASVAPSPFVDYTCTDLAAPPGKVTITKTGVATPCVPPPTNFGINFFVPVPGGATTEIHPYGYQLCCSSPLVQSMAADGNRAVNIDNSTHVFNEFSVTSTSEDSTQVPTLSAAWIIVLVAALIAVGVWLLPR